MVCPYSPKGKKKGCEIYDKKSFTCNKSDDLWHCGNYRALEEEAKIEVV